MSDIRSALLQKEIEEGYFLSVSLATPAGIENRLYLFIDEVTAHEACLAFQYAFASRVGGHPSSRSTVILYSNWTTGSLVEITEDMRKLGPPKQLTHIVLDKVVSYTICPAKEILKNLDWALVSPFTYYGSQ